SSCRRNTRVPKVQEVVSEIFGKIPSKGVNPDEAVAMGVAIQGGILRGDVKELLLLDVTPLSLGIETLGGIFTRLINETQPFLLRRVRCFLQQLTIRLKLVYVLFELMGIPPAPERLPQIEVTFDIDANGIVTVSAKDKQSGKEQQITIKSSGGLSESDIEKMIREAELNAQKDQDRKSLVDMKKHLSEYKNKIPAEVAKEIEDAISDLRQASTGDNVDEIKAKLDIANKQISKIGQHMSGGSGGDSSAS
ncbi:hypothetical protein MKW92_039416, partial [Papaver armeniacum]